MLRKEKVLIYNCGSGQIKKMRRREILRNWNFVQRIVNRRTAWAEKGYMNINLIRNRTRKKLKLAKFWQQFNYTRY